jgi:DNA-binding NarL/FixJ family response regulator
MIKIKVMLSIRPNLISEVIHNLIDRQPDMNVMSEVPDPIELFLAIRTIPVDVVIINALKTNGEPRICRKLLDEHPLLKIITLSPKGEAEFFYQSNDAIMRIHDMSGQTILNVIRESVRKNTGRGSEQVKH